MVADQEPEFRWDARDSRESTFEKCDYEANAGEL